MYLISFKSEGNLARRAKNRPSGGRETIGETTDRLDIQTKFPWDASSYISTSVTSPGFRRHETRVMQRARGRNINFHGLARADKTCYAALTSKQLANRPHSTYTAQGAGKLNLQRFGQNFACKPTETRKCAVCQRGGVANRSQ